MGLMNEVWKIMDTASKLKEDGKTQEALETYNAAFNMLIDMSGHYAREQDYLKRDNTAATILNEMGLLFMDQGEAENARQKFLEAIDYIPGGEDFSEPADNLERLVSMYVPEEEQSFEE
jgi:tetratricopeptide (TPR) repeat protein